MSLSLVKTSSGQARDGILDNLNEEQKRAVTKIDGSLLIVAGAGSGKTRVLTNRIAYLIDQGIKPYNILSLTFTNKAAEEMKERISKLIPPDAVRDIWAGTFHSIFARILRFEAESIGYTSSFSIYDSDDSQNLVKKIITDMNFDKQNFSPPNVRSRISWAKNQMMDPGTFRQSANSTFNKVTADVYFEYENQLKINNAMDFDDLLINMIHVLRNNKDILEKYRTKFKYILVDEYQDTNKPQYEVCKILSAEHGNICVVGDDAQSIYKWRGADIRNILEFRNDFPNTETIRLERNYRSTKNILGAADSLIKNNHKQIAKDLWTENEEGEKVILTQYESDRDESDSIIKEIRKLVGGKSLKFKDFAILYRINAQSLSFENSCRKHDIPYIIIGGMSFYKRKEIKDVFAYLKLLCNPKDSESLLRIVNEPPRGIGETSLRHIQNFAKSNNIPVNEAFIRIDEISDLQNRAKNSAKLFMDYINLNQSKKGKTDNSELVLGYIENCGMLQMFREIDTEDSLDRLNNVNQLLTDISEFFQMNPELEIEDYLQQVSLVSDVDDKDFETGNQVKLMTLHSAKGLEFPVVFIAGLEKGLLPHFRSEQDHDEEEEERRLFYVGITRAREKLYLSHARYRMRFAEMLRQAPSKFIQEIDSKFVQSEKSHEPIRRDTISSQKQETSTSNDNYSQVPAEDNYSQIPEEELKLQRGNTVKHAHFGIGRIEAVVGEGSNVQVTVYFQSVGRKKLMLQYARLEKVRF